MPTVTDLLNFEQMWWRYPGAKEQAIRDTFGITPTRFYMLLNAAIDSREALEVHPVLTRRLQRLRDSRRRARSR